MKIRIAVLLTTMCLMGLVLPVLAQKQTNTTRTTTRRIQSSANVNTGSFTISLAGAASQTYSSGETIEVNIVTDTAGVLQSHFGSMSVPIAAGVGKYSIGRVAASGFFYLRFVAGTTRINKGILILPAGSSGKFTAEIFSENLKISEIPAANQDAFLKFIKLVDGNLLSAAWRKALPNWIVQNMANVGQAAVVCGIATIGTAGGGAVLGCVVPGTGIMVDAFAAVLSQAADDLKKDGKLTDADVTSIKRVINFINGAYQTVTTAKFERIINAAQTVNSIVVDQTDKAQITGKLAGDFAKKYEFILRFRAK